MSHLGSKDKGTLQVGQTAGGVPGFADLPIGPDGTVLTADSTVDKGAAWTPPVGSNVALFTFTHIAGPASTGPLGFTPKFAIYTALATDGGSNSNGVAVIKGTGTDARWVGRDGVSLPIEDPSSALMVGAAKRLTVTAFGPGGITLTWAALAVVSSHTGHLMVVG